MGNEELMSSRHDYDDASHEKLENKARKQRAGFESEKEAVFFFL